MDNSCSPNIKGLPDSNSKKPVWKKPVRVADTMFVAIPESIVKKLRINEECSWFEVSSTSEGIFLKIASKKVGSSDYG
jgi:hypothetical protein